MERFAVSWVDGFGREHERRFSSKVSAGMELLELSARYLPLMRDLEDEEDAYS